MCGIAGLFAFDRQRPVDVDLVRRMTETIRHRGPDGDGVRAGSGYALGHRRLAIVDLAGGGQPMALPDEKVWVTFNGEIYNYLELRDELVGQGATFRTNSDTEVLLHGYRAWGTGLAERLRGMFAFVIVDDLPPGTSTGKVDYHGLSNWREGLEELIDDVPADADLRVELVSDAEITLDKRENQ